MKGFANPERTGSYASRFNELKRMGHFRGAEGLWLSSIGLGTYLGETDEVTDEALEQAARHCLERGINVIDSAVNYRAQRSERVIGKALHNLVAERALERESVFISTKGGFIPFDQDAPEDLETYLAQTFFVPGILEPREVVRGCHAMTPRFLACQLDQSLRNLRLDTVDLYYIHNPEMQLEEIPESDFYRNLAEAFKLLEQKVLEGKIRIYGTATWNGYRTEPGSSGYVSLERVLETAEQAGGSRHHLRAVQLPYNLAMLEAFTLQNQPLKSDAFSAIEFARRAGLLVFTSASLLQGRLARGIPQNVRAVFEGCESSSACALQFVRSTPGVTTALCGMKSEAHISENLSVLDIAPLSQEAFAKLWVRHS